VNGRIVPLLSELHSGDEVEIARAPGQVPPAAWASIVVTGKARAAIRRATRAAVRKQYAGLGRQIVERAFERAKKPFNEEKLRNALPRLARSSLDDVLAAVGRGEIFSGDVVKAVHPDYKEDRAAGPEADRKEGGWFGMKTAEGLVFKVPGVSRASGDSPRSIPIRGLNGDLPVTFAPNGGAVPGDRIVGILTPGEGITIYPIQSPALTAFDDQPDRWLDVRWDIDETEPQRFPAQIEVTIINEPGALAQVAQIIGDNDGNIDNLNVAGKGAADFRDIVIDLEVWNLKHLNAIINQLKSRAVVSGVKRVNG
jgi:GTP pyrophosphokinase